MELQICEWDAHRSYSSKKTIQLHMWGSGQIFPATKPEVTYKKFTQIIIIFIIQVFFKSVIV